MSVRRPRLLLSMLLAALLLAVLGGSRPGPATAAGTLDTSFEPAPPVVVHNISAATSGFLMGESFVPSRTGHLDHAALLLTDQNEGTATVQFELYATSGGAPSGPVLAAMAVVVHTDGNAVWIDVFFSSPPIVLAGTRYALLLRLTSGARVGMLGASTSGSAPLYDGGNPVGIYNGVLQSYPGATFDLAFRTYVEAPPDTHLTLSASAAPNPAPINQPLTFTFVAGNTGPGIAYNSTLTVDLPAVVQVQGSITVSAGILPTTITPTCRLMTLTRVGCALGDVAAARSFTVTIPVRIISTTIGAQLCARGVVTGGLSGAGASTATAQSCPRAAAPLLPGDLAATIDCPTTARDGFSPHDGCSVTVRNIGGAPLTVLANQTLVKLDFSGTFTTAVGFIDDGAPTGFGRDISTSAAPGTFSGWLTFFPLADDIIPAGGTRTFTVSAISSIGGPGTHIVTATVDPNGAVVEGNEGNNVTGPLTTTVSPPTCVAAAAPVELDSGPETDGRIEAWRTLDSAC